MAKQNKNEKSARLKELEDVFERRTRRFSPFEVLGLKSTAHSEQDTSALLESTEPSVNKQIIVSPHDPPMGGTEPPTPGSDRPTSGGDHTSPGVAIPTKV